MPTVVDVRSQSCDSDVVVSSLPEAVQADAWGVADVDRYMQSLPSVQVDSPWTEADAERFLGLLLAMSLRDDASVLAWHPWRHQLHLGYLVKGTWYSLMPVPEHTHPTIVHQVQKWLAPNRVHRFLLRSTKQAFTNDIRVVSQRGEFSFCGVCWPTPAGYGFEFHRLDLNFPGT
ncbi:MAG: hypothetical protein ACRC8S_00510 [Fimbriiglobus sp.]